MGSISYMMWRLSTLWPFWLYGCVRQLLQVRLIQLIQPKKWRGRSVKGDEVRELHVGIIEILRMELKEKIVPALYLQVNTVLGSY